MLLHLWQRVALVVIVVSHNVAYSEWIKVPLKSREPDFSSFERDTMISDKMESFSLPLDVDYPLEVNHTRQMDLRLEKPISSTRREDGPRKNSPQVTKKKIVEPFSIFNFIRKIQKSFFFKSQPSVKEKVGFLERIRDNILSEIKRRLMSLFPLQRRKKRDLDSSEHGHDFVSMDGALVTICFLTFSVFLIKLVLQIIYLFKAKHYTMAGSGEMGTVGAVRLIKKNKFARDFSGDQQSEEDIQEYLKVMQAINRN